MCHSLGIPASCASYRSCHKRATLLFRSLRLTCLTAQNREPLCCIESIWFFSPPMNSNATTTRSRVLAIVTWTGTFGSAAEQSFCSLEIYIPASSKYGTLGLKSIHVLLSLSSSTLAWLLPLWPGMLIPWPDAGWRASSNVRWLRWFTWLFCSCCSFYVARKGVANRTAAR